MNKTFISDVAPDGSEHGQHPAPGPENQPDHPTECIKLPPVPKPVHNRRHTDSEATDFHAVMINDARQLTRAMWAALRPVDCSERQWEGGAGERPGLRAAISARIMQEKRGKIFPLGWSQIQALVDQEWQVWQNWAYAAAGGHGRARAAVQFEERLRSMDGLRGMAHDAAQELIREEVVKAGLPPLKAPAAWNLCHRVVQAAHKKGAQEMQGIMHARDQTTHHAPLEMTAKQVRQHLERMRWLAAPRAVTLDQDITGNEYAWWDEAKEITPDQWELLKTAVHAPASKTWQVVYKPLTNDEIDAIADATMEPLDTGDSAEADLDRTVHRRFARTCIRAAVFLAMETPLPPKAEWPFGEHMAAKTAERARASLLERELQHAEQDPSDSGIATAEVGTKPPVGELPDDYAHLAGEFTDSYYDPEMEGEEPQGTLTQPGADFE